MKKIVVFLSCLFCAVVLVVPFFNVEKVSAYSEGYHKLNVNVGTNFRNARVFDIVKDGSLYNWFTDIHSYINSLEAGSSVQVENFHLVLQLNAFDSGSTYFIIFDYDYDHLVHYIRMQKIGQDQPYLFEIQIGNTSASIKYNTGGFDDYNYFILGYYGEYKWRNTSSGGFLMKDFVFDLGIYNELLDCLNNYIFFETNYTSYTQTDIENAYNDGYDDGYDEGYRVGNLEGSTSTSTELVQQIQSLQQQNNQLINDYNNLVTENENLENSYNTLINGIPSRLEASRSEGYNAGYSAGVAVGGQNNFLSLMTAVVDAPLEVFTGLFDLEILGFNLKDFLLGICSAALVAIIVRFALRFVG